MAVPLTTTFVPPPECTQDIRRQSGNETESYLLLGGKATNTCLPSFFTPTFTFFYSPGLYCPSGYLDNGYTKTLASVTETIVTCCPSSVLSLAFPAIVDLSPAARKH
ncbi:hypothetical protein CC78DRAFT_169677 [Lojkania enalia]|uniref:Uncharacterized protein n=1 Tax=Lojkania enalia TaxID=147567 RepID=A0A9P4N4N4_9PLEO|nr:hypothetical protein CC78DRAFT_169677 [Didymosphaeria enalia]